jgi:hypothetical protein
MELTTSLPRAAERQDLKSGQVVLARFQRRPIVGVVLDFDHSTWLLILGDPAEDAVRPRIEHLDNTAGPYRPIEGDLVFEGGEDEPWGAVHPGRDWPGGTLRVCHDGELLMAVDHQGDLDWYSLTKGEYSTDGGVAPYANYTDWRLFQRGPALAERRLVATSLRASV